MNFKGASNDNHATDMRRVLGALVMGRKDKIVADFPDDWDDIRIVINTFFHDERYENGFYDLVAKGEAAGLKPSDFPRIISELKRRLGTQAKARIRALNDPIAELGSMVGDYRPKLPPNPNERVWHGD